MSHEKDFEMAPLVEPNRIPNVIRSAIETSVQEAVENNTLFPSNMNRDQILPGQPNGEIDAEKGGSPEATTNGIPKKERNKTNGESCDCGCDCATPGCFESIKNIPDGLKKATWNGTPIPTQWGEYQRSSRRSIPLPPKKKFEKDSEKTLFLLNLVTIALFPLYDVIMDLIAAVDHYNDGELWYFGATLAFVIIPVILRLWLGKGWKELHEAATLKKFKERNDDEEFKSRNPHVDQQGLYEPVDFMPKTCTRIKILIQTVLGFVPGLSWVPLPDEVSESNDDSYDQMLLAHKMYDFFGEDAPQFLLQVAIELSRPKMTLPELCRAILNPLGPMLSSFLGLIGKSTAVYLELSSKDKYEAKIEPYTNWKNKWLIATPLMIVTVVPRVLTLSVILASCFSFPYDNDKEVIRFGIILFICTFILYALGFAIGSYVGIIRNPHREVEKSKLILSGLSALISPCLIVDQISGVFFLGSCLSFINHVILLVGLILTLEFDPSMWNPSLANSDHFVNSKGLYTQLVYVLLPWLSLSLIGSYFLDKFGRVDFRNEIGKALGLSSLGYEQDGKEFSRACKDGQAALVKRMLKLSDSSALNHPEKGNGVTIESYPTKTDCERQSGLHLACENNKLEVVKVLLEDPNININVKNSLGRTGLHLACIKAASENHSPVTLKIIKLLVDHPNIDIDEVLQFCISDEKAATALVESEKFDIYKPDWYKHGPKPVDDFIEFTYRRWYHGDWYRIKMIKGPLKKVHSIAKTEKSEEEKKPNNPSTPSSGCCVG